eukprot:226111-Chlamydomonas_euryale.AAC.4
MRKAVPKRARRLDAAAVRSSVQLRERAARTAAGRVIRRDAVVGQHSGVLQHSKHVRRVRGRARTCGVGRPRGEGASRPVTTLADGQVSGRADWQANEWGRWAGG